MKGKKRTTILFVGVIGLFIILHATGILAPIEHAFRSSINTTSSFVFSRGKNIRFLSTFITSKKAYEEQIRLQQEHIDQLYIDNARLLELEDENSRLREMSLFLQDTQHIAIGAEVIGRSIDPIGTSIIIDQGRSREIQVGNPVVIGNGILIGKIIRVDENSAIVELLNDSKSRIASTILNHDNSIGIVEGGFGIVIRMKFIPQNEQIDVGDIVVTSGLEEELPRGLVIGTVEAVEKKPQEPFQEAVISPVHDLNNITLVNVLIN